MDAIVIEVNNKKNNNQCGWCQHLKAIGVVLIHEDENVFVCRECFEKSKDKKVCNRCNQTKNLNTILVNKTDISKCTYKAILLLCPKCMKKEKGE